LGENPLFRSAYVWFLGVPVAAKAVLYLRDSALIPQWLMVDQFQLPFSWQAFFYAATSIAFANVVYFLRCPKIVRQYADYTQFHNEGRGVNEILSELRHAVMRSTWRAQSGKSQHKSALKGLDDVKNTLRDFQSRHCVDQSDLSKLPIPVILSKLEIKPDALNGAFWSARTYADTCGFLARVAASIGYALGLAFVALVIYQNIRAVYQLTTFQSLFP
jgi:hypothetical protein